MGTAMDCKQKAPTASKETYVLVLVMDARGTEAAKRATTKELFM